MIDHKPNKMDESAEQRQIGLLGFLPIYTGSTSFLCGLSMLFQSKLTWLQVIIGVWTSFSLGIFAFLFIHYLQKILKKLILVEYEKSHRPSKRLKALDIFIVLLSYICAFLLPLAAIAVVQFLLQQR